MVLGELHKEMDKDEALLASSWKSHRSISFLGFQQGKQFAGLVPTALANFQFQTEGTRVMAMASIEDAFGLHKSGTSHKMFVSVIVCGWFGVFAGGGGGGHHYCRLSFLPVPVPRFAMPLVMASRINSL